ncbi:MAG TPA: N-acetylmuramoyl-L-alanine amidase, partial [Herbaspirillum sp.]|nr:N-acetylmuramoyl-L-alanine amidase [Herbaspirillum sp.]
MNKEQEALQIKITDPECRSFLARTLIWLVGTLALPLAGCGHMIAQDAAYTIDTSIQSPNQNSRVRTLVLHYTAETLANSIALLTDPQKQTSSHYLVPDAANGSGRFRIYALVPESRRAWHAGVSYWQGERMLNASTVGIEVVNLGFP